MKKRLLCIALCLLMTTMSMVASAQGTSKLDTPIQPPVSPSSTQTETKTTPAAPKVVGQAPATATTAGPKVVGQVPATATTAGPKVVGQAPTAPTTATTTPAQTATPAANGELQYKNEKFVELYSFDSKMKTYHKVTNVADQKALINNLNKYDAPYGGKGDYGFLVLTENGRYDIQLAEAGANATVQKLISQAKTCNQRYVPHIQWVVFMGTPNINEVYYMGPTGAGFTNQTNAGPAKSIQYNNNNKEDIAAISAYLKDLTLVRTEPKASNTLPEPQSAINDCYIKLTFKSGATYGIAVESKTISIQSSDMPDVLTYEASPETLKGLYDFMAKYNK